MPCAGRGEGNGVKRFLAVATAVLAAVLGQTVGRSAAVVDLCFGTANSEIVLNVPRLHWFPRDLTG
jgi:hypothetical protein